MTKEKHTPKNKEHDLNKQVKNRNSWAIVELLKKKKQNKKSHLSNIMLAGHSNWEENLNDGGAS